MHTTSDVPELPLPDAALTLLRSGPAGVGVWSRAWEAWVDARKPIGDAPVYDLAGANLSGLNLTGVDLSYVNLRGAHLTSSILTRSDFFRAELSGCKLDGSVARFADFRLAIGTAASAVDATFVKCNLQHSSFRGADLRGAILMGSDLSEVIFAGANLEEASFHHSILTEADFTGARLDKAGLWNTHLTNLDLTPFASVEIVHHGPSHIDWRAVLRSVTAPRLLEFLAATGMPEIFASSMISAARSIADAEKATLLQTTFISFGGPDTQFAQRLHEALAANGVVAFFFPESAQPGARLSSVMNRGVNEHDRMILVCSKSSLSRPGVRNEIQLALDREAREGGSDRVIAVAVDDFVFSDWWPERPENCRAIRDRVIVDFRDSGRFATGISKLLTALQRVR